MVDRESRWCKYLQQLYAEDLAGKLQSYIAGLPEEIRTDDEEYARRLAICSTCGRCADGLCGWCGCFVAARAAKSALDCPNPGQSKWKTERPAAV